MDELPPACRALCPWGAPRHRIRVRKLLGDDAGFGNYLRAIQRFPLLDREAEQRLARLLRDHGDRSAADQLVEANLRFVVKIATQYRGYGLRIADLVEEGNVGLIEATRRFDPERNLRFMTYAAYWIRAYILAHVLKHWSIVGVGTGPLQSKMFFRLQRERARALQSQATLGDGGTSLDGALATTFNTTEDRVRDMAARLDQRDSSLDAQAFRDGPAPLVDFLVDGRMGQDEQLAAAERDQLVRTLVAGMEHNLDPRERMILSERLMRSADEETTLADLGRKLGLSRERVRQLEERVKQKLRRALEPVAHAA